MPASHYTDEILQGYAADVQSEVADWPSPLEAALHFASLHRLAVERPADHAARVDWMNTQ